MVKVSYSLIGKQIYVDRLSFAYMVKDSVINFS